MKATCRQEDLIRGLGIVERIAKGRRQRLPITDNVLITADRVGLTLAATDLEISIRCRLEAKVKEEGAIAVPARLFADLIRTLPADSVSMTMGALTRTVEVKCQRSDCRISGTSAEDFPPFPSIDEGTSVQLDPEALGLAITQVAFAAATEDTRPVLTGCLCEFEGDTLTLAAADGFRLAVHKAPLSQPVAEKTSVIIPARALHELHRLIAERDEPVDVTINPTRSQVLFRLKDVEMVSQLIQGTPPSYAELVPKEYTTRIEVDRYTLVAAMRVAGTMANLGDGTVRLEIYPGDVASPGRLTITTNAQEIGDNQSEVFVKATGPEARIAFNHRYVMELLRAISADDDVAMEITTPTAPGVFRPVGDDNYVHVIMPRIIKW